MTDPPNRQTDNNGSDDHRRPATGGVSGLLRQLLETIQRLDESGGRVERGHGTSKSGGFEYEYRLSVGLGDDRDETASAPSLPDQPVRVEETLDGARVTIDLPGVDPESLRAGVRGRRLVVAAADEPVARIRLPESGYAVRTASYNNGVLELLLGDRDSEVTLDD